MLSAVGRAHPRPRPTHPLHLFPCCNRTNRRRRRAPRRSSQQDDPFPSDSPDSPPKPGNCTVTGSFADYTLFVGNTRSRPQEVTPTPAQRTLSVLFCNCTKAALPAESPTDAAICRRQRPFALEPPAYRLYNGGFVTRIPGKSPILLVLSDRHTRIGATDRPVRMRQTPQRGRGPALAPLIGWKPHS